MTPRKSPGISPNYIGGEWMRKLPNYERADHMLYGGVKESGTGREDPRYAIEDMTGMKLICWKV